MSLSPWAASALRLLGRVVPIEEREEWVREWRAEVENDPRRSRGERGGRLAGTLAAAAEDALRLRVRRLGSLRSLAQFRDLRFAVRSLARKPLFTLAVVATLALGVGANAAMFTVVDAVVLTPLPYRAADRIAAVRTVWTEDGGTSSFVSTADFDDLTERVRTLEELSMWVPFSVTYHGDESMRLEVAGVSSGYFRLFASVPHLGRYLVHDDDERGREAAAVLSYGLWERVFGRDPGVVGRTMTLDGRPYVVAGVAERGLKDPVSDIELWTSRPAWIDVAARDQPWLRVFGRLAPGVSLEDGRGELDAVSQELTRAYPDTNTGHALTLTSLAEDVAAPVRPALLVLAAVVGLVLLITCANVANLILVRAAGRGREMAVRVSLGAGRGRLAGQLLVEGLVIAVLGGAAGVILGASATRVFASIGAPGLPRLAELRVDGAVLAFTLLVSCVTGVVLGLVPLLQVSGADPSKSLRESGRPGEGRRVRRLRRVLVATELAASTVLLVGAGLLVRSLVNLTRVETGVQTAGVLVFRVAPFEASDPAPGGRAELRAFYERVVTGLERLPGVEAVGGVSALPFTVNRMYEVTRDDLPAPRSGEETLVEVRVVEPGYFRSVGIPLLQGRLLGERDDADAPPAILVDEAMTGRFFSDVEALGRRVTVHWGAAAEPGGVSYEVVGVVGSVRHMGPASPATPAVYVPRGHDTTPYWENFQLWITMRASGAPDVLGRAAGDVVRSVDPTVPIMNAGPFDRHLRSHRTATRNQVLLVGAFALLATLLASVGIAGVVAYAVAQRGHELGLRQALGAESGEVVRLVLGEGARLVGAGIGSGLLLAGAGARVLRSFLFGVEESDPLTYAAVGLGLALLALLAAWLPARRAAEVGPAEALRKTA
jgi:putative ABC transport system permease protein